MLPTIALAALLGSCAIRCGSDADTTPKQGPEVADAPGGGCVDGKRALTHIERLVSLGPRHAGTPGAEKARQLIIDTLGELGLEPKRQDFTALTPHPDLPRVELANITAQISGPGDKLVLIGGHFDGKLLPGIEFKGANDGGSSTALLLELARCLKQSPPPCGVRIAFFDGEEALVKWSDSDGLFGSKHMATQLKASGEHEKIAAMVNLDMIGDKRLRLYRETQSTQWVFTALERAAIRLGHGELFRGPRGAIDDDHVPFLRIGIPAANLIDLKFGPGWDSNSYWHTAKDTVDKVSPDSMAAIGAIVVEALPDLCAGKPGADRPNH
jgi:hypothetical protein